MSNNFYGICPPWVRTYGRGHHAKTYCTCSTTLARNIIPVSLQCEYQMVSIIPFRAVFTVLFIKKLKNVSCEYDRLNGWNSTLQAGLLYLYIYGYSSIAYLQYVPGSTSIFAVAERQAPITASRHRLFSEIAVSHSPRRRKKTGTTTVQLLYFIRDARLSRVSQVDTFADPAPIAPI